jgi:hypothetical protein
VTEIFLERRFEPPLSPDDVLATARIAGDCFGLYRVRWRGSLLATDGRRMCCHFSAPDAESARIALRQVGADITELWPGSVHDAPSPVPEANVLVERRFEDAVELDTIQAIEDRNAWCLRTHDVRFQRTFFSADRRRMICLYRGPDAESVRIAQRQAGLPLERVWAFRRIAPEQPLAGG